MNGATAMDRDGMAALSSVFRAYTSSLPTTQLQYIERAIQQAFDVTHLRNVQLWTRSGATQRNFVNPRLSTLEIEKRVAFAQALMETRTPTFPTKEKTWDGYPDDNARRMGQYLNERYTRSAVTNIYFNAGDISFVYDAYGYGYDDEVIDEDDLEEFL